MYEINSAFRYGSTGVFRIAAVEQKDFSGENKQYYLLQSVHNESSVTYIPVDNELLVSKMYPVLEQKQIEEIVDKVPDVDPDWIDNDKLRAEEFKRIMDSDDRLALIGVIKGIRKRKNHLVTRGKKLRSADDIVLNRAEKLLFDEFSLVAGMGPDQFWGLFRIEE